MYGNLFCDCVGIEQAFLKFYSNLLSNPCESSFSSILNALSDDLSKLFESNCNFISREVTWEEVYLTILDLLFDNSPSKDVNG